MSGNEMMSEETSVDKSSAETLKDVSVTGNCLVTGMDPTGFDDGKTGNPMDSFE